MSSQSHVEAVNVGAIMDGADAGQIEHGAELLAMAEAMVIGATAAITRAREALIRVAGAKVMVDAVGVASNFQRMVRIADSTGITLGNLETMSAAVRDELGINRFAERH